MGNRWLEHATLHGRVDLIALPLVHTENVQFYPLDLGLRDQDIVVSPGDSVSIVGFPFGMAQDAGLPIWKTGTVASDSDVNFNGQPMFIVDTTSRQGMSGSPFYAVRTGAYRATDGNLKMQRDCTVTLPSSLAFILSKTSMRNWAMFGKPMFSRHCTIRCPSSPWCKSGFVGGKFWGIHRVCS